MWYSSVYHSVPTWNLFQICDSWHVPHLGCQQHYLSGCHNCTRMFSVFYLYVPFCTNLEYVPDLWFTTSGFNIWIPQLGCLSILSQSVCMLTTHLLHHHLNFDLIRMFWSCHMLLRGSCTKEVWIGFYPSALSYCYSRQTVYMVYTTCMGKLHRISCRHVRTSYM